MCSPFPSDRQPGVFFVCCVHLQEPGDGVHEEGAEDEDDELQGDFQVEDLEEPGFHAVGRGIYQFPQGQKEEDVS